jgi:hypothetical protein
MVAVTLLFFPMTSTKDAYYFSHDGNARNDVKCLRLRREMGLEGYGLFWCLIEMLREEESHTLPLDMVEDIAFNLHTSKEKTLAVITRYGLFEVDDKNFFSVRLKRSMDSYKELKNKFIEAGRKGGHSKAKARLEQGSNDPLPLKESKVNEIKEKKSKANEISELSDGASAPTHTKEELVQMMLKRKEEFVKTLEPHRAVYGDKMINEFCEYWVEPNKSHTKFRKELEKTWHIDRRLKTWAANQVNFQNYGKDRGTNKASDRWEALGELGTSIDLSRI